MKFSLQTLFSTRFVIFDSPMSSLQPLHRQQDVTALDSAAPRGRLDSQVRSELVRRCGGIIAVPRKLTLPESAVSRKLTKLLLNVNIQRSLGPVQVVMSPENSVRDLIKAAIEIYVNEKRRPLLPETDIWCYALHYSQFSLESLKLEEKLINLGSRNFFLCQKPGNRSKSSCGDEAKKAAAYTLLLTRLMDCLL